MAGFQPKRKFDEIQTIAHVNHAAFASMAIAAPKIEPARIDSMVKTIHAAKSCACGCGSSAARKQVEIQLQSAEILKDEALKVGLDKNRDVQIQLKNLEAQFYAAQYMPVTWKAK